MNPHIVIPMMLVAFAVGVAIANLAHVGERRLHREQMRRAAELMGEVSATLRIASRPLPMALHRRICDFRARWQA